MPDQSYRVMYHVGDEIGIRTKVLTGTATVGQEALTIVGPVLVTIPFSDLHAAQLFRLHGLGRCIRVSHTGGVLYIAVVRFVILGLFATINFLRTGELARRLSAATPPGV